MGYEIRDIECHPAGIYAVTKKQCWCFILEIWAWYPELEIRMRSAAKTVRQNPGMMINYYQGVP